jgi:hypothetical protein
MDGREGEGTLVPSVLSSRGRTGSFIEYPFMLAWRDGKEKGVLSCEAEGIRSPALFPFLILSVE